MNNFEKIKNMTLDEMAELSRYSYDDCPVRVFSKIVSMDEIDCSNGWSDQDDCYNCFKQWLQAESEG